MPDIIPFTPTAAPGWDNRTPQPVMIDALGKQEQMMNIRTQQNQQMLFQQQFQAKQKAGQILAQAPDIETGLKALQADPLTAVFAPEIINTYRQMELTNVQKRGHEQEQYLHGYDAILKALPSAYMDRGSFTKNIMSRIQTLPKENQAAIMPSVKSMIGALYDDLPEDPAQAAQAYKARLAALMVGAGFNGDSMQSLFGKQEIYEGGGFAQPGVAQPAWAGGGFQPAPGGPLAKTLPPTVATGPYGEDGAQTTSVIGGQPPRNTLMPPGTRPGGPMTSGPSAGIGNPGSGASLQGPSIADTKYMQDRAADVADYEKNLDDRVQSGATLRKNLGAVLEASKQAQFGGGAEVYMKLGQALQAIGVDNDVVDKIAGGSLPALQTADKVNLTSAMQVLKQDLTGVGGSRLNAQEFVNYLNKHPNIATDPRAMVEIFNLWQQTYDRGKIEQEMFRKAKAGKPTGDKAIDSAISGKKFKVTEWPALWANSDYMGGFAPSTSVSGEGVKGVPQAPVPADVRAIMNTYGKPR